MIEHATPAFVDHGAQLEHMYSDAFEFASDILDKSGEPLSGASSSLPPPVNNDVPGDDPPNRVNPCR